MILIKDHMLSVYGSQKLSHTLLKLEIAHCLSFVPLTYSDSDADSVFARIILSLTRGFIIVYVANSRRVK